MDRAQALEVIGLDDSATQEQVASACKIQSEQLAGRISSAPTPALRAKYEAALGEISKAAQVLGAADVIDVVPNAPGRPHPHETPLSQTKLHDLPSSTPIPTMSDSKAAALDELQLGQQLGLQQGQVLAGRYEVRKLIGMGGMGAVYSAFDSHLDEEIAIKVLTPSLLKNEQARERFMNEARTSSRLSHPNIVNVHDVQREGELFFLTMELLRGKSLRQEIEEKTQAGKPFSLEEVKAVAKAVGDALSFAHATTIHRDIKPENIWIGSNGEIKLMDFGIARVLSNTRLTQTAMVMGTAYYMAPEQLQGSREIDARADQYALAVVLYEMLTGKIPAGRVKSVRVLRPTAPEGISAAIDKALESDPAERYENVAAFLAQLNGKVEASRRKKILAGAVAAAVVLAAAFIAFTPPGNRLGQRMADLVVSPDVITSLKLSNASQRKITVAWDNEPVNATKLVVLRSEASAEGYAPVGEVDPGAKSYTDDRGIDPEKVYFYKVLAKNSAGKYSKLTNTPPLKVESLPQPPPAPSQLEIARKGTEELELAWKGKYPPGTVATLLRSTEANGKFTPIAENIELIDGENKYTDAQDLQPDTQYFYKLVAQYKGVSSPVMPPKAQRTLPLPPEKPAVKPTDVTQTTVKLTWPDSYKPGTAMRIERSELKNSNYETIADAHDAKLGSFEDSVDPKKQYFYKVTAVYDTQPSPVAGPIEVMTKPPQPGVVTALKGTARDGKILLSWAAAADPAITYRVRQLVPETNQYTTLAELKSEQSTYEHAAPADKDLKFDVTALNSGVESTPAAITVPAAPKLTATQSEHGALLEWQPSSAASNFQIYRVDVSRVPEKIKETTERMFVDNTAKPGMEYEYFVSAVSGNNQGISESPRQKVVIPLDVPQNIRVTAKDGKSAEIAWDKPVAATVSGFEIERTDTATSTPARFTVDRAAASYVDTGLAAGKTYIYKVASLGGKGERAVSADTIFTMTGPVTTAASTSSRGSGGSSRKSGGGGGGKQTAAKVPARHTATPHPPVEQTPQHTPHHPPPPTHTPRPSPTQAPTPTPATATPTDPRVTTPQFPTKTPRPPMHTYVPIKKTPLIKIAPPLATMIRTTPATKIAPTATPQQGASRQTRERIDSAREAVGVAVSKLRKSNGDNEDENKNP